MFSTVAPERQPSGYYAGGVPVNVPSALSPYTGADAANPFDVKQSDIERDTPGKRSNVTVQYARLVVARGDLAQAETADLERVGALAILCAYNPPGVFGGDGDTLFYGLNVGGNTSSEMRGMIDRLGSTPGLNGKGVNKPSRLISYNYLTTLVAPSVDSLSGLNNNSLKQYIDVFGNQPRSRITHLINLALANGNNYSSAGINLLTDRPSHIADFIENKYVLKLKNPVETITPNSVINLFNRGFELDNINESPFLVPAGYCDYAKTSSISTTQTWPPLGATSCVLPDILQQRANVNATSEVVSSGADDARVLLYNALFHNDRGLMSPVGVGPWRPDGFVIYKYSTFGMDKEAERALDAQQNALYNIAIGGQTLVTELSTLMLSKDPVGGKYSAATSVYQRAQQRLTLSQRRMTMPGDMIYLLIIGQVTKENTPIAELGADSTESNRTNNGGGRLVNLRFEMSTSEELSRGSTPLGEFAYTNTEPASFFDVINSDELPSPTSANSLVLNYDDLNDDKGSDDEKDMFGKLKTTLKGNKAKPVFDSRILYSTELYSSILKLNVTKIYLRFQGKDSKNLSVTKYDVITITKELQDEEAIDSLKSTADVNIQRLETLGLGSDEVIVGGWQLGRVIDSAATRAVANGSGQVSNMDGAFGLNVVVEIRPITGLNLHHRYWSRKGMLDL